MGRLQSLLEKAQQGDQEALESLLTMFQPLIHRCSRNATLNEREDLKQELNAKLIALIRIYRIDQKVPQPRGRVR